MQLQGGGTKHGGGDLVQLRQTQDRRMPGPQGANTRRALSSSSLVYQQALSLGTQKGRLSPWKDVGK